MRLMSDVHAGRIDPLTLNIGFDLEPKRNPLRALVRDAVGRDRIRAAVDEAEPRYEEYRRLKRALAVYRRLAATRPELPRQEEPAAVHRPRAESFSHDEPLSEPPQRTRHERPREGTVTSTRRSARPFAERPGAGAAGASPPPPRSASRAR